MVPSSSRRGGLAPSPWRLAPMQDDWSVKASIEIVATVITAVTGLLSIVHSLRIALGPHHAGTSGTSGPRSNRRVGWAWFGIGLVLLMLGGLFVLLRVNAAKIPLVLIGSGNVESFLTERVQGFEKLRPVMLDVGSGAGASMVLKAAEFGGNTLRGKNADLLVALSSAGNKPFETAMAEAPVVQGKDNAWLSLEIARVPIAWMYTRPDGNAGADALPKVNVYDEGAYRYRYIACSELKGFYENPPIVGVHRPVNEPLTGTRANLEDVCEWDNKGGTTAPTPASPVGAKGFTKGRTSDPLGGVRNLEGPSHPVHYLEDIQGPLYGDVRSWPPLSSQYGVAATCDDLKKHNVQTAVICNDCSDPSKLPRASFVVVIRLTYREKEDTYEVATEAGCKLAKALAPRLQGCEIASGANAGVDWEQRNGFRLAKMTASDQSSNGIPDYLNLQKCP